jgi:hypothetical protein
MHAKAPALMPIIRSCRKAADGFLLGEARTNLTAQIERVPGSSAERRVIEDAPNDAILFHFPLQARCDVFDELFGVGGVIHLRGTV